MEKKKTEKPKVPIHEHNGYAVIFKDMADRLDKLERRIDNIIDAHDKCKKLKGL